MPGRKGRSRGCLSCRKRKIKCDETLPICRRCKLSCFSCEYPAITFVEASTAVTVCAGNQALMGNEGRQPSSSLLSSEGRLVQFMTESYLVGELCQSFSRTESPATAQPWIGFLANHDKFPLGRKCLLTLAQTYVAQTRQSSDLVKSGTRMYLESMKSLRYALGRPHLQARNDVILSIMILSLYEMLVLSSDDGWIKHALGLASVIELRAPESFSDSTDIQIFEANRFMICLASLATSRSTFLSRRNWKTRPWKSRGLSKDHMQCLLDSVADLATLNSDIMARGEISRAHFRPGVLRVVTNLSLWRKVWESWNHGEVVETIHDDDSAKSPITPVALRFPTLFEVSCVSIYNAALIQATVLLDRCSQTIARLVTASQSSTFGDGEDDDYSALTYNAALEICMTAQGCLPQAFGDMTLQFVLLYPLRMAWVALGKSSTSQGVWIEQLLEQFSSTKCSWSVIRQVLSNQTPESATTGHMQATGVA